MVGVSGLSSDLPGGVFLSWRRAAEGIPTAKARDTISLLDSARSCQSPWASSRKPFGGIRGRRHPRAVPYGEAMRYPSTVRYVAIRSSGQ